LRDEKPTLDNTAPDVKQLEGRAAATANRIKTAQKRPNYGLRRVGDKFQVVVNGDYIGVFDYDEAKAVRDAALAKQFGYKLKEKQSEYHQTDNAQNHAD
jgi:hypothetical protein